jgi:hypothetical protein
VTTEALRAAILAVLIGHGAAGLDGIHGWRCGHPKVYGDCTCVTELVDALAAAVTA